MARKYIKQIEELENVNTADEALLQYSTGWRTAFNPMRRVIRRYLDYKRGYMGYQRHITNARNAYFNAFKNISPTSKFAAVLYTITKNDESLNEISREIYLRAAGLDIENRQQTFVHFLSVYSAPWYKRLFTGDLRNRHVCAVREILHQYEQDEDFGVLLQSINALDKVEGDPLEGLNNFYNEHCERQDAYLAEKRERKWRERCDQEKWNFIENIEDTRNKLERRAWILVRAFNLLGHTEEYISQKELHDKLEEKLNLLLTEKVVEYDTVTEEEYDGIVASQDEIIREINKTAKELNLAQLEDEYRKVVKPINELKDDFDMAFRCLVSDYKYIDSNKTHGTLKEFDVDSLLSNSEKILTEADSIKEYSEIEWLNNMDDIRENVNHMKLQSQKNKEFIDSCREFDQKFKKLKDEFDAAFKTLTSDCSYINSNKNHGTLKKFDVDTLLSNSEKILDEAESIRQDFGSECLNNVDKIRENINNMHQQIQKNKEFLDSCNEFDIEFKLQPSILKKWLKVMDSYYSLYESNAKYSKEYIFPGDRDNIVKEVQNNIDKNSYESKKELYAQREILLEKIKVFIDKCMKSSPKLSMHYQVVEYLSDIFAKEYLLKVKNWNYEYSSYMLPLIEHTMRIKKLLFNDYYHDIYVGKKEEVFYPLYKLGAVVALNHIAKEAGILFNPLMSSLFDGGMPDPEADPKPSLQFQMEYVIEIDEKKDKGNFQKLFHFLLKKILTQLKNKSYYRSYAEESKMRNLMKKIEQYLGYEENKKVKVQTQTVMYYVN